MQGTGQAAERIRARRSGRQASRGDSMRPKEQTMPSASPPRSDAEKRREQIHRAQLNLVQASLRAGVQYQRPGRVAKAASKRS
jgi:hypothetical protein